jgi:hypothetical protein
LRIFSATIFHPFAGLLLVSVLHKAFTFLFSHSSMVICLGVKLSVDGEEIELNEFVSKILNGTIVGAVTSLRGIEKNWKQIKIEVTK